MDEDAVAAELRAAASRWPEAPRPDAALLTRLEGGTLHVQDVFLAWWAGQGTSEAIAAFERAYGGELARIAARFPAVGRDELLQQLRIKLFVGEHPRILDYGGTGPLLGWLRVVAVRAFVDATRAARGLRCDEELDEEQLVVPLVGRPRAGDTVGQAIKGAFAAAVAQLTSRERVFLRHAYLDRMTLDQIATMYAIHRATVARVLGEARAHLVAQTRAGVGAAIGVAPGELATAIDTIDRRLELSLSRVLHE